MLEYFLMKTEFKNKKVLLIGLGILGGGISIANWLLKNGAKLSITDTKPKEYFKDSIKKIKGEVNYFFENINEQEIKEVDIVIINQAIGKNNPLVLLAKKFGKSVYNESNIFYKECTKPIIAITGTRGKTTTTNWIAHLLGKKALIAGNSSKEPLLKILPKTKNKNCEVVINEIPSFQLENFDSAPYISIITNFYVDHLNRHGTLKDYAVAKANIFKNQTQKDKIILNQDSEWTDFFLKQKPQAEIWFFSLKKLPKDRQGIYYENDNIFLKSKNSEIKNILNVKNFIQTWGKHNLANLLSSLLAVYLYGEKISNIKTKIKTLPQIKYREELIYSNKNITVINDTSATSPEGGIVAIERFGSKNCILISGGTDANLEYKNWAKIATKYQKPENIVLLDGSATTKMLAELKKYTDISKITIKNNLKDCIDTAFEKTKQIKGKKVILFSPAAKSFEKFKNEFDRGEQFNKLIKNIYSI